MTPSNHGLKHFAIAAAIYLVSFFVAFAPYAFIQDPEQVAKMMGGAGGWALIAATLFAMVAFVMNLLGVWTSLKALRQGPSSKATFGLLLNLLPVMVILSLLYSYRAMMF
ncbi:hypothetical protein [Ferrimonas kyonanensis]|uniref:hypothetical protein n=1 Tax=Ferrimonas kyonanensis TaxID=364763 RepID=UPI0003FFACE9|nr:hypothetical protein [Ferrimonas kyonanensis]